MWRLIPPGNDMATADGLDERRAARTDAIQSHADEASEPETGGSEMDTDIKRARVYAKVFAA